MKKFTIVCLLLVSVSVRADVTMVEVFDMKVAGLHTKTTTKIKGSKIWSMGEVTGPGGVVRKLGATIDDIDTGEEIQINHADKTFTKVSGKEMSTPRKVPGAHSPDANAPDETKIEDTGKTEKVGNYNTRIYKITGGTSAGFTLWVTRDIPNYAYILQELNKRSAYLKKIGRPVHDDKEPDGVIVKTQTDKPPGPFTITLISLSQDPIGDAEFRPPADYVEKKLPTSTPSSEAGA